MLFYGIGECGKRSVGDRADGEVCWGGKVVCTRREEIRCILKILNFIFVVSLQCGEFAQSVVNFSSVVNKIETHQTSVIRNGTVLP